MYVICTRCRLPCAEVASRCPACSADLEGLPRRGGGALEGAVLEGRYELVGLLGEGSMAWVYRGLHAEIGSSVAVKLLKPAFAEDPSQVERFRKEAAAISVLSHPHILSVISSGETASRIHYMVTEFIQGRTLARLLEEDGPLPLSRALDVLRQILYALEEAHRHGIVHRDLKPENVMVIPLRSGEDFCKIVDFGIALRRVPDERRLTKAGMIIGTPAYMAPEVIRGEDALVQSDLFSAGVMLYEMITGELPWRPGSLFETLLAHLNEEPVPLRRRNPALPARAERLVARALVKEPAERIPSAAEFLRQLQFGAAPTISVCPTCLGPVQLEQKFCPHCGRLQQSGAAATGDALLSEVDAPVPVPGARAAFTVPFRGREEELAAVRRFLAGDDPCLELTGEDGVGKAALLEAAFGATTDPVARVLRILPDLSGARRAWWPVRALVVELGQLGAEPSPDEVTALCRRLGLDTLDEPHALHLFDLPGAPAGLENRVRLREMTVTAARLIHRATVDRPTLLVFQDAHLLDGPSLAVLERLAILCAEAGGVRLIVTARAPVVPEVALGRPPVRIPLERLPSSVARPLCMETLAPIGAADPRAVERLLGAAGGLPLHLAQGLRLLHEGIPSVDGPLPDLVLLRARNLPAEAHRLLQWTAVCGGRLMLGLAGESGLTDPEVAAAVEVGLRHGFLAWDGEERLRLAHPAFWRILLAGMPVKVRADLHLRLYDGLRVRERDPRILAEHAFQARQLEAAASYFERAGARCEDQLDDAGAALAYRRAYELTELGARQGFDLQRFQGICLRLGDLLRYTGALPEAERVLQEALLYGRDDDPVTAQLLTSLARCLCPGSPEHAERLVQRAVRAVTRSANPNVLYRVFFDIGTIALQTRRFESGLATIRTGLSLLEGLPGAPDTLWRLHVQCARCEAGAGRFDQAMQTCLGALERPEVKASWIARARLHEELAQLHLEVRNSRGAFDQLQPALAALRMAGDRTAAVDDELRLAALDRENRRAWAESAALHARQIAYVNGVIRAREL